MILAEAGIRPGMRVLDLGCGAGDATFVAADLVGSGGSVVGVDHSPDALARARLRAGQRGLAQVQFIEGDFYDPAPGGPYDAIVERLALWQVPDPAEVLRRQATVLRPGGLVVPIEGDATTYCSEPEITLCDPVRVLGGRSDGQGRDGLQWPAAVGHPRRGGAAPAGDDRDPAALRTRRRGWPCLHCGVRTRRRAAHSGHRSGYRRGVRHGDVGAAAQGRMETDPSGSHSWWGTERVGDNRAGITLATS